MINILIINMLTNILVSNSASYETKLRGRIQNELTELKECCNPFDSVFDET